MSIAVGGVAEARAAFEETLRYVQDRKAFGTTIGSFQNTKFVLAEIATEIDVAQAFVDRCVDRSTTASCPPRTRPRPSGGAPNCRAGSSTGACSCTAATAT